LVFESIAHAREDFQARRFIELKNKADADLRHTERGLSAPDVTLTAEQRQRIEAAAARTREAMGGDNGDDLQQALDELNAATNPLAEQLMNAVVRSTLRDKDLAAVNVKKL
jgi:hypothetical protein